MRFSQRIGLTEASKAIQLESIDDDLRNSLWSLLAVFYWERFDKDKYDMGYRIDYIGGSNLDTLFRSLWLHYFKKPIDTIPAKFYDKKGGLEYLREHFFSSQWYEVLDFIEFISEYGFRDRKEKFIEACNTFLERENSGYRFVDNKILEISSSAEVEEIEAAIAASVPYAGSREHLKQAIELLSDRKNPDCRNSIKESISAVESLCKVISGDNNATLGKALNVLERSGKLHPALKSAFSSIYGYTSDANGIRHALMEKSTLTKADARFMLISCSAFINYMISNVD